MQVRFCMVKELNIVNYTKNIQKKKSGVDFKWIQDKISRVKDEGIPRLSCTELI